MSDWIGPEYLGDLHAQSYAPRPRIEGVLLVDLPLFHDEGGDFCEIGRLTVGGEMVCLPGYRPVQLSYSLMEPGAIKAWHLHRRQDDLWFVPPSNRLLVGLLDVREASATYRTSMRFVMGAGEARLLYIPCGVAHGVANLRPVPASIIYFTNQVFDAEAPDEHRLPSDLLGKDFWTIQPG